MTRVMHGLAPGIYAGTMPGTAVWRGVDGRDKPGYDGRAVNDMRGGSVYIVTNRPNGTLYLGVTNNLSRRIFEHRSLEKRGFTQRYKLTRLVWYEHYPDIRDAIQRERTMKHWSRAWKVRLILDMNPNWTDVYDEVVG